MRYIRISFQILFGIIVVLAATLIIGTYYQLPIDYRLFTVLSGSMEPEIPTGSIVLTKFDTQFTLGDVITYNSDSLPVTHRITSIESQDTQAFFQTKGDANTTPDPALIAQQDIVGKVLYSVPKIGFVVNWAQTPIGFVALVVIPATIIIWEELKLIGNEAVSFARSRKKAAVVIVFSALSISAGTYAMISDSEVSTQNTFAAGEDFGTVVPLFLSNPYTCTNGATNTSEQFGAVSINPGNSLLFLTIKIEDATPNAAYDIWINQNPGACPLSSPSFPEGMTTDSSGDAIETFQFTKNSTATSYWISAVGGGQVLRSIAVN